MKTNFLKYILAGGLLSFSALSCGDLDLEPYNQETTDVVYSDFANYKNVLAKLYGGFATSGQQGPDGDPDITGFDEGKSNYIRAYWQLQELTTDEAVIGWNDGTIFDLHDMDWTANNEYIRMMYDRIYYQISLNNEFIRETSDEKLESRGLTAVEIEEARYYRAESRFLRALSYWHAMDLFGSVPFVTEEDGVGSYFPEQISRADLFEYVESELIDLEDELMAANTNEYGRVDQAAAWTLLAKVYLNAEVYTGTPRYTDAITYAEKVIGAGYQLEPEYARLFMADNDQAQGVIFPIAFHGRNTASWGGTTFITHAAIGGEIMNPADFGVNSGWAGLRTTAALVDNFPDLPDSPDERAMIFTEGQELEIENISAFTDGYAVTKYSNLTSEGVAGSDPAGDHTDNDFPMFRLADVYLIYAEAVLRGGEGGAIGTAVEYINELRERAYDGPSGNISASDLNLDFILAERARELYWEAHRRTDLIRFNRFTGADYLWPWKGGVKEGRAVGDHRVLFPIPVSDLRANPNLEQNSDQY